MAALHIRDYQHSDAKAVDALGLAAFAQYKHAYTDWSQFAQRIASMSTLAATGELIVAELDGVLVGAVAYIGPFKPKQAFFQPEWPIMRMLVVAPQARGHGVGRALADACLARAKRDRASTFALHTSAIMDVALPMYLRMGFTLHAQAPMIHGVAYNVYVKNLN